MNELLLKYNHLDAFGKQELMDFLEFLIVKKNNKNTSNNKNNAKWEAMKLAAHDPLYLEDIREIQNDFEAIDHETI